MKKLSTMMAVLALVATGCDPYEDAPGGDPEILAVSVAGLNKTSGARVNAVNGELVGDQWQVAGVPVSTTAASNDTIVIVTNKLLDGATIQTEAQDPSNAASTGDCTPAGNWLTVTKNGVADNDPGSDLKWYTCYYAGAATPDQGSSIVIFRAPADNPPTQVATTRPLMTATLDPAATYVFTGTVKDDSGNDLPINVQVSSRVMASRLAAQTTAANSVSLAWTMPLPAGTTATYDVFRAPAVPVEDGEEGEVEPGEFAEIAADLTVGTYTDAAVTDADTAVYYYRVTATPSFGSPNNSAVVSNELIPPTIAVEPDETSATALVISFRTTNATSYTILRSDAEDGTYTAIAGGVYTPAFAAPAIIEHTDTGLTTDTEYFYKVEVSGFLGDDESEVASGTPVTPDPAP
jgi:hypothetical protein